MATTYYATLTYYPNDGSSSWSETESGVNEQGYGYVTFSLPTLTRTGYTFNGWVFNGSTYTGSITLYASYAGESYSVSASWTETPVSYTIGASITYDPANGEASWATPVITATSSTTYGYITTTMDSAPTRTGYTFAGWSISGSTLQPGASVSLYATTAYPNYTATALWTPLPSVTITANITYDNNGGTPSSSSDTVSGTSAPGETSGYLTTTTPSTAPTKAGYNFVGWLIQGTLKGVGETYSVLATQAGASYTYTAQYTAIPQEGITIYDVGWHTTQPSVWNGSSWVEYDPSLYDSGWN